jgi:type IV pilus assembly protein PilA
MDLMKNKKGFTLIELLAVIVILAILILVATTNIGSVTQRARKNVLGVEGNELVSGSKTAYQLAVLDGQVTTGSACFSLEYLYQEGYFSKGSTDGYKGSVFVDPGDNATIFDYYFWINDKNYTLSAQASGATGTDATKYSTSNAASEVCEGKAKAGTIMFGWDASGKKATVSTKS